MGFSSSDCTGCGHPLLSEYATDKTNTWMQQGVTIFADGSIIKGRYDGYGRYEDEDMFAEPIDGALGGTVWHEPCWKIAGSPADFRGQSNPSEDQGYFFDGGAHSMPEPKAPVPAVDGEASDDLEDLDDLPLPTQPRPDREA